MNLFLIGAGFNADAGRIRTPYGADCQYPLVSDIGRLCFGLESGTALNGKSIEDLFADAQANHNDAPMKSLTDKLMEADYYLASALATAKDSNCYRQFFEAFLGWNFLTFNYDSLLEICLFQRRSWFPEDGYGVPVEAEIEVDGILPSDRSSRSLILHLHGSFCLRSSEFEIQGNPRRGTGWLTPLSVPRFMFDPDSISHVFMPYRRVLPDFGYRTTDARVIAPVPNKGPQLGQAFVRAVYQRATTLVAGSDVLVSVGYSFNVHDRVSYGPILHALNSSTGKKLVIVSPDAERIVNRVAAEFRNISVTGVNKTFKQWADQQFPF
jgi:hypothetical protein